MAPAASKCWLLDIPAELRLLIYEHVFCKLELKYNMQKALRLPLCEFSQRRHKNHRCWALPLPPEYASIGSGVFFKQPLLRTCQLIQREGLSLYMSGLGEIDYKAASEYERVVKTIKMLGKSGRTDALEERVAWCRRDLECVLRTTRLLREAAI